MTDDKQQKELTASEVLERQLNDKAKEFDKAAQNSRKVYNFLRTHRDKEEILIFCLDQLEPLIYTDTEYIDYLLKTIENADNTEDFESFYKGIQKAWEEIHPQQGEKTKIPELKQIGVKDIFYPLDKVNRSLTRFTPEQVLELDTKKGIAITTILSFDIEELRKSGLDVPDSLTAFDIEVFTAAMNISIYSEEEQPVFTASQIYELISGKDAGNLTTSQKKRIKESLARLAFTRLTISNEQEIEAGLKYPKITIRRGIVLNTMEGKAEYHGKTIEAYQLREKPALLEFARERKQITTIPRTAYAPNMRLTDININIKNFLLYKLSKHGESERTISYKDFYRATGAETDKQKDKAREVAKRILGEYKKTGFIQDFTVSRRGITVKK